MLIRIINAVAIKQAITVNVPVFPKMQLKNRRHAWPVTDADK